MNLTGEYMISERNEGFLIVALLAVSTVVMMTIIGAFCVIGNRQFKLDCDQEVRVGVVMNDAREEGIEAKMLAFLA